MVPSRVSRRVISGISIERTSNVNEPNHRQLTAEARPRDFLDPIEFIYWEHERIRICCEELVRLADDLAAEDAQQTAASVLAYLEDKLPLHLADEEEDLFPLVRRRCLASDKIVSVLLLLVTEHRADVECGRGLLVPLRAIAAGGRPSDPVLFGHYTHAFRILQQRHQRMENNEVMPWAIEHLSPEDKTELGRRMAARRGVSFPG